MASLDDLVTYLRLAPEFGGTRFGPFEGLEVRLGSNPERCHIVLSADLGVLPEHAKLLRQRDNSLILTPAERTATIFLWKPGDRRPAQVLTPTAVRAGDAFSLVTPDGPRFIIELDQLPPEIKEKRAVEAKVRTGRRRLSAETMAAEGKRQFFAQLLTYGPAQLAQRAKVFIKSGAIYQPRNIFLGIFIVGGYLFGGFAMCSRKKYQTEVTRVTNNAKSCEDQLAIAKTLGQSGADFKFHELAAAIVQSPLLGTALESDSDLRAAVQSATKNIFLDQKPWDWIAQGKGPKASEFANWRELLFKEEDIDLETARLLMWVGAEPGPNSEFRELEDSQKEQVCGRGLLRLTYRHAKNLGLDAQPDALVLRDYESVRDDKAKREELLLKTMTATDPSAVLPEGTLETGLDPVREGVSACLYLQGDDDRPRTGQLIKTLARQVGKKGTKLPDDTIQWSPTARIAKYWSAELQNNDLTQKESGIDFTQTYTGTVLSNQGDGGKWVLDRTARTIAKAIAIPCIAVLKGNPDEAAKIIGADQVPPPVSCLVLDWKLRNDT